MFNNNTEMILIAWPNSVQTLVDGMAALTRALPVDNITMCLSILVRICYCAVAEEK